ncbi:hypothetical protein AV521_05950 [Streptomyces sp. IMTB 2501]|uniref:hypothetical protein n=1 Tax=Streptomyces sp. IMTB 2501 TaxID=1776340 RepID=UPI00096EA2F8|nr:hypothetical protein [Streptomyces sp. IMTB 2501]OLZ73593.1 hypothetical protein AV521_05950 [Streptomyces sp. IMTB 2501]
MSGAATDHALAADAGHRARRDAEARHLVAGLHAELADWSRAGADGGALEKHQSQIESAVRVVSGALERLTGLPAAERRERAPELVLDLHHLWDFFRTKLLVRHIPHQRRFLSVADELAWAVYDPVRRSAAAHLALREPPLTFLDRHPVPFAAARGSAFEELLPSGAQRTLAGRRAAAHLPFPVIGIPWPASHHLPSVLAVAHETGHHIEDDFGLTAVLGTRLRQRAGLPAGRLAQWQGWMGEVFADLCATLACGEAYVLALDDALAAHPAASDGGAHYPPRAVRVRVCRAALDAGPAALPGCADAEAHAVVQALIGEGFEELGGARLRSLVGLRRPAELPGASARLAAGLRSKRSDVPGVLAAATLAFVADPARYDRQNVGERALLEVLALVPRGPRAATATGPQRAARDSAAGHDLFDLLRAAH